METREINTEHDRATMRLMHSPALNLSKAKKAIIASKSAGYRIDLETGDIYGKAGQRLSGTVAPNGYRYVSLFIPGVTDARRGLQVAQHQMIAYEKYGDAAFVRGIETRHKDGDRLNNIPSNILIGTRSQNMMDMPPEARSMRNKNRPSKFRALTTAEAKEIQDVYDRGLIRGECADFAQKFGLSPSTISSAGRKETYRDTRN